MFLCCSIDVDASSPVYLPLTQFVWNDCIDAFQVKSKHMLVHITHFRQMCTLPERRVNVMVGSGKRFAFGSTVCVAAVCSTLP